MGKNNVQIVDAHKPKVVDPTDVVLKITGTTGELETIKQKTGR